MGRRVLYSVWLAMLLSGCESPPVPDVPRAATVTGAPVLVASPQGPRLVLMTEQSLRRTEKRSRPSGRIMVDGSVTFSVMRHELWALDPATLSVSWRRTVQEFRPSAEAVAPRIAGHDGRAVWWRGDASGAVSTRDWRAIADAGPPPPGSAPAGAFNAPWHFHLGPGAGDGGPLRLPGADVALRAQDPEGHFQLHIATAAESPAAPFRLERMSDAGRRTLWSASLPLRWLHGLSATDGTLLFFGMADAGKVPGTDHDAQGSHVLVAVDIATGRVTTLDVGQASLVPAPP